MIVHRQKQTLYKVLALVFFFFYTNISSAQSHKVALSLTGGIVQDGFGGALAVDYKVNEFDYIQFNALGIFAKLEQQNIDIPVHSYSFNPGYFFDVIRNNSRKFGLALGAGGIIGYESINNGNKDLGNDLQLEIETNTIIYGAYVGLDADIFISPVIAIHIKANELYHVNSEAGEFTPYVGVGIKLIIK
ncbi:conjugal transfer protein TraO [Aquimarina sp. 2201CG14-23]|uniref:conjugal transfer protein TraO n=1 Tax=Aquimarina mycalae TaxID=3040073 RepID=UPI002477EE57|nr:conjugal transfer protein TraO [Aquimarina sp. 2201CG14-23]MDH7448214.1 conjugal transfer protein TraO [Aquimarina sp. 2201CG14-23]